ncbi:hypothetical protein [Paraburkholderia sp. JHI869]|uniref:hypothetical protein n=1 Tax=Paraburkholderia sp. JHI869 TaxID=3112959 RepID=UPI00316F37BA
MRPPPLTAAELAAIYDAEPTATIWRLMHEIHRLRAVVIRSNQIRTMIGARYGGSVTDAVWAAWGGGAGRGAVPDRSTNAEAASEG